MGRLVMSSCRGPHKVHFPVSTSQYAPLLMLRRETFPETDPLVSVHYKGILKAQTPHLVTFRFFHQEKILILYQKLLIGIWPQSVPQNGPGTCTWACVQRQGEASAQGSFSCHKSIGDNRPTCSPGPHSPGSTTHKTPRTGSSNAPA